MAVVLDAVVVAVAAAVVVVAVAAAVVVVADVVVDIGHLPTDPRRRRDRKQTASYQMEPDLWTAEQHCRKRGQWCWLKEGLENQVALQGMRWTNSRGLPPPPPRRPPPPPPWNRRKDAGRSKRKRK